MAISGLAEPSVVGQALGQVGFDHSLTKTELVLKIRLLYTIR